MPGASSEPTIYTTGHSTRPFAEFLAVVQSFEVRLVADVRSIPRSRRNPQFDGDTLAAALRDYGVDYQHMGGLGGRRSTSAASPNLGWRNLSFRGYADHMQTPAFAEALEELIAPAAEARAAVMCAEAVPWRCHRYLIADALVVRGFRVEHLMAPGESRLHVLNVLARVDGGVITYPAPPDNVA